MIQLLAFILPLSTIIDYPPADIICQEVQLILLESVEDGVLTYKEAADISVRCYYSTNDITEWYVFHYYYPHPL